MIKREFAENWTYKLKKYWLEKNIDGACSLLIQHFTKKRLL